MIELAKSNVSPLTWFLFFLTTFYIIIYNWRRRHLYYHASKFPGLFSLPLIGSVRCLYAMRKNFIEETMNTIEKNPPVFKAWVGTALYIFTSRPEDVEIILNQCLEKPYLYKLLNEDTTNSLFTATVDIWKQHRQIISHSFSPKVLNSFVEIFSENARKLVEDLNKVCGKEESDLMSKIWKCTLDITHEALTDIDSTFLSDAQKDFFRENAESIVKITLKRFYNIFLHLDLFWEGSALRKEVKSIFEKLKSDAPKIIDYKLEKNNIDVDDDDLRSKRFLNYLLHPKNIGKMERRDLESEMLVMCVGSSETKAVTITSILVVLGVFQEIQEKLFQEISTICPNDSTDVTLDDLKQMTYLERVIKETMRIFPSAPLVLRYIDKNIYSGPYVFPAGSNVCISIAQIHKDPSIWPNPLKFDPDRFLPEEATKRHRCAYIPFSFGPRNCIGYKYAMMSMKVILAEVVRNFKIKTLKCKSLEELEIDFNMLAKFKNYTVVLEKRKV